MKYCYRVTQDATFKYLKSKDYNYVFNKATGMFARWGATREEDPNFCEFGPEILDIEVTTKCNGPNGKLCPFCYKGNTPNGINMSLDTFKTILNKMPNTLTQIAFGADAQATSNPDLFKMMEYARSLEIIPNITVADISDETADKLVSVCGAVAVSRYADKDICYNSVKKLIDRGLKQTNIHFMLSKETYEDAFITIGDYVTDDRLKGLNAIVFLSLKQKGRGIKYNSITKEEFKELINESFTEEVPIGFDSCSAPKFLNAVKYRNNYKQLEMLAEPCESSCFSSYIDAEGKFFPCSFSEGCDDWKDGIDVVSCNSFVDDIWHHPRVEAFRNKLMAYNRSCPLYKV
jgi:MoaA/NifB/PqqE/SkfB family radical SAM enzyme